MDFITFMKENLSHVVPVLAVGLFGIFISVERFRALVLIYPMGNAHSFFEKIRDLLMNNRVSEAIALCDRYGEKPAAKVVRAGLLRAHQPEELIEHGIEISLAEQSAKVQLRTSFLSTIANVATLLGLFGTILGLIQSFNAVGNANAQQRSALLAAGISTAMNATMLGLAVAIPAMIMFAFLTNRTNRLNAELDQTAVKTLDLLKQRYYTLENHNHEVTQQNTVTNNTQNNPGGTLKRVA